MDALLPPAVDTYPGTGVCVTQLLALSGAPQWQGEPRAPTMQLPVPHIPSLPEPPSSIHCKD